MAAVQELIGDYTEAASLYKRQLDILDQRESGDQEDLGHALKQLSKLARISGDYPEAENFLARSLEIARNRQNTKEEVDILYELSGLRRTASDLEGAERLAQEGFEKARSIHYVRGMIETLKLHGSTRWTRNRLAEAKASYVWALEISLESGDRLSAGELRELLSKLEATLGRDIFISYTHSDQQFVARLAQDLLTELSTVAFQLG
jgi:tetratricopeptide (TPR) repeat protein